MPSAAVEALAAREDVAYISPDRETYALGHVSATTGADAARLLDTTTSTSNNGWVSIAVLDSGVDLWHKSFYNAAGSSSRVTGNYVFTNEGATGKLDDTGTHARSIAAAGTRSSPAAPTGRVFDAFASTAGARPQVAARSRSFWRRWTGSSPTAHYNLRVVYRTGGCPPSNPTGKNHRKAVRSMVASARRGRSAATSREAMGRRYGAVHCRATSPRPSRSAPRTRGAPTRGRQVVTSYAARADRSSWKDGAGLVHHDNLIKKTSSPRQKVLGGGHRQQPPGNNPHQRRLAPTKTPNM